MSWWLLLLLLRSPGLELALLILVLLPYLAGVLRMLRLLLLLPESLLLAWQASELWLHGPSSKASRLGPQSALEAAGLAILLLLL